MPSKELTAALESLADWKQPPDCACDDCVDMCRNACMPTPLEAEALISAGVSGKLCVQDWYLYGDNQYREVSAVMPTEMTRGARSHATARAPSRGCVMQDEDGLCTLHAAGLKPIEGRLAHHSDTVTVGDPSDTLREAVLRTWDTPEGRDMVRRWCAERGFEIFNY